MPSQKIPKLCRHARSGRAYVTLDGTQYACGTWNTKAARAEYDRLIGLWVANGRKMPDSSADGPTVSQLCVQYMRWALPHYRRPDGSHTSEIGCLRVALRRLRKLYGPEPAKTFGPVKLKALRETWVADGHARATINGNVRRIQRAIRWCVSEELIPANVAHALDCVRGLQKGRSEARETEAVEPVDEADMRATLPHLSAQAAAIVELCWWSAMRPGEACKMRMSEIDREGDTWLYRPASHKTAWRGKQRTVLLGPNAQAVLRAWLRADPDAYLFQPAEAEAARNAARRAERTTPMTPSQRKRGARKRRRRRPPSEHYTTASLRRSITRACDKAKIEGWAPNQLRHAAATRIRREMDLESAAVVLGHGSAVLTAEVYAQADFERARRAMAAHG